MVKQATFISKENAKKIMMKEVGEDAFEILDGVNPLPTSIHVNLTADYVNPDSAEKFAKSIMKGNEHLVSEVAYNEAQFLEIGNVFKNFELIMLFLSGTLLLVATLLIYNTIRLAVFSKRFLLRTMQLVGAKSSFIRRPFLYRHTLFMIRLVMQSGLNTIWTTTWTYLARFLLMKNLFFRTFWVNILASSVRL